MFHHVAARHQRFVADYVLPSGLGRSLHASQPEAPLGPVMRGLRQWLRLRILTDEPMGMPSVAVWSMWRELVGRRNDFEKFCKHAYGHSHPDFQVQSLRPPQASAEELALTWAMACADEHLKPPFAAELPALFAADQKAGVADGVVWLLQCHHEPCSPGAGRCVHHELVPALPDRVPKQIHFDDPAPYPLIDKSDSLTTPNGLYGY
jgi:hypothetical protein